MSTISGLTAIAVTLLRGYFEIMRMAGRTPEEAEAFYQTEKAKFEGPHAPGNLPKVD